ncbi:MAG TPA: class I SAM-dependent RNA methyltransferase, partial [Stellaceae bacterium]|nr:class I SAM-dependent RNA methyltransferase [Stellaceae bacterium]
MKRSRNPARPPETTSEPVELVVDRIGAQGDGIAQGRGAPVFLPFTVPGDRVRARLGARRGEGHEGRVVERLASGAGRVEPVCRHFGACGGCALQHLDGESYRAVKLGALSGALRRAGLDPGTVAPLVSPPPARRRARLGLVRPRDPAAPAAIGFRERFSHKLVDLAECAVLEPALFALVAPLRRLAPALATPGGTAELMLTRSDSGVDLLIERGAAPGLAALETLAAFATEHDVA